MTDHTGRGEGPEQARERLATLLGSGVLREDVERGLLEVAGESGISFSDEEVVGVVRNNPDVAGLGEDDGRE